MMRRCGTTCAVTVDGKLLLQEDPGNTPHNAKVWLYDPVSKALANGLGSMIQHVLARR